MNFGTLFLECADTFGDRLAIEQDEIKLTYSQLLNRTRRLAQILIDKGAKRGSNVTLLMSNDYRFPECFFGIMMAGATVSPINIKLGTDTLAFIINDSEAEILICNAELESTANVLLNKVSSLKHVIIVGDEYENMIFNTSPLEDIVNTEADDTAVLMYTSGTTGRPKGCMLTHKGKWWLTQTMAKALEVDENDKVLIVGPLYHANAMWGNFFPILYVGGTATIMKQFDKTETLIAIHQFQPTFTSGTPAMFSLMLSQEEEMRTLDFSSLKFIMVGSSPVYEELMNEIQDHWKCEVLEGYGLTEGGVVATSLRNSEKKIGSTGPALPGVKVRIINSESGVDCLAGEIGELWIQSPALLKGYWKLPEVTKEKIGDGWLKTRDLMEMDDAGNLYFKGRKDDMINCGGENIYPREVETILLLHPSVAETAVIPVKHKLKGEVPVAWVVLNKDNPANEDQLIKYCLENGPKYAHPRRIFFKDSLPLSGTNKVDIKQLIKETEHLLPYGL